MPEGIKLDPKNFIGRVELNTDKDDLFLDESPEEEREFMVCVGGPKLGELYDQLTSGEISEDEYRLKKDSIVYEFEKKLFAKKR